MDKKNMYELLESLYDWQKDGTVGKTSVSYADDFLVGKFLGTKALVSLDDVGLDFEESLSERNRLKLQPYLIGMIANDMIYTHSTGLRGNSFHHIFPTKHVIMEDMSDTPISSSVSILIGSPANAPPPPPTVPIDLTTDGPHDMSSPPLSHIMLALIFMDLSQYISSPKTKGSKIMDGLANRVSRKET
ncbi:hypothetical protein R1sor_018270 [Riccia sorocarpa]|uniref:Uncharacterized protein n=1 Tax=Riccia sorocarpa TaxID=122646 RepID=A0ABD3I9B7_9MARC